MGTLAAPTTREAFLGLDWASQKAADLRKVFDPETDTDLTTNCIMDQHRDDTASMVIYKDGVWCFGCKTRLWPDQFLRKLGDLALETERGARKVAAPKYIPLGMVKTYNQWLCYMAPGWYQSRLPWLLNRGLSMETLVDNMIGHTGEAFSIPIFEYGIVRAIRYRRDDELACEDRPKYWGTPGANASMLYVPKVQSPQNTDYGVILCEGELDALRLAQEGYPAISLTNGCNALTAEHAVQIRALALSLGTSRITICYDQDQPGIQAAENAYVLLNGKGASSRCLRWPGQQGKDVTEYLKSVGVVQLGKRLEFMWGR